MGGGDEARREGCRLGVPAFINTEVLLVASTAWGPGRMSLGILYLTEAYNKFVCWSYSSTRSQNSQMTEIASRGRDKPRPSIATKGAGLQSPLAFDPSRPDKVSSSRNEFRSRPRPGRNQGVPMRGANLCVRQPSPIGPAHQSTHYSSTDSSPFYADGRVLIYG